MQPCSRHAEKKHEEEKEGEEAEHLGLNKNSPLEES
jgi:hypothetical protein